MIEVYGREGCGYCVKAKELLESKQIPFKYFDLGTDVSINEFKEMFPNQKTVPVITAHGMKIGGYTELVGYIEETAGGYGDFQ